MWRLILPPVGKNINLHDNNYRLKLQLFFFGGGRWSKSGINSIKKDKVKVLVHLLQTLDKPSNFKPFISQLQYESLGISTAASNY